MIDMHIHAVLPRLPGVKPVTDLMHRPPEEVAVAHRGVNFVRAHFGNPWVTDAAEVLYKNDNVWADLSGILVGDADYFGQLARRGLVKRTAERVAAALEYTERTDRFLYGS